MLDREIVRELSEAAKEYYTDTLPYHNWSHAEAVMLSADALAKRVIQRTTGIDSTALHIAAAWHDAGFYEDHTELGFKTKENYSAELADQYLGRQGIDGTVRSIVRTAILGTIHDSDRSDIHALMLHRADVANVGSGYQAFYTSSVKLWRENALATGDPTWNESRQASSRFAQFCASEAERELPRLGEPTRTRESFDTVARSNAIKILNEPQP